MLLTLASLLKLTVQAASADDDGWLAETLPVVFTEAQRAAAAGMIERDISRRSEEVNLRNREEWAGIKTREQWEAYRDERIERLRRSLGEFPTPPAVLDVRVTGVLEGEGFRIENLLYESRPGDWVSANLYVPANPARSTPGLLIAHAHHRDKSQSELQDMGMTWARAGCLVLVIDQVGYGERRSHPFQTAGDFAKPYAVQRQDYYFRRDTGIQLQLLGDSLMGWMAWDLMRGVDLLLSRDGIDPAKIIVLGAVAGGGDPAGVAAALDRRIACCVPFNFGGPQPETAYPLPDDAEASFNYLGGSYWDSTRGLRLGGRDGFLHWIIVGSTAPRRLIHAHEFSWDQERDPVWKRYQKIWGEFYGAEDRLGAAHGTGLLRGQAPEASHCTNIGRIHRRMIHPLFKKWFGIQVGERDEYSAPRKPAELICLTQTARSQLKPKGLNELMGEMGRERIEAARQRLDGRSPGERRATLREDWGRLLGPTTPANAPQVKSATVDPEPVVGAMIEQIVLEVEPGILAPILILRPMPSSNRAPVVIGLAQTGKSGFLRERGGELRQLIAGGAVVVLPDLRGTGETRAGDADISTNLQLFGETLLGERLRDLRSVIAYLRGRPEIDIERLALWGESFSPVNPRATDFKTPRNVDGGPTSPEPLGGLLALLGALFEDDVAAVAVAGGLASYHSVLTHFAVLIPHGASVPGALTAGDLCDIAGCLTPMPLRLEGLVDHLNRTVSEIDLRSIYDGTVRDYSNAREALTIKESRSSASQWLLEQLRRQP